MEQYNIMVNCEELIGTTDRIFGAVYEVSHKLMSLQWVSTITIDWEYSVLFIVMSGLNTA